MATVPDGIQKLVTPALVSSLSAETGVPEAAISKGLSAALPAILMAITNRLDLPEFEGQLAALADSSVGNLQQFSRGGTMVPGRSVSHMSRGDISNLLGSNLTNLGNLVARFADIPAASAASLLSMAATLVVGYLGLVRRSERLDSAGLATKLRSERGNIAAIFPAGFDVRGLLQAPTGVSKAGGDVTRPIDPGDERVSAAAEWVTPLMMTALAVGALLWWGPGERTVRVPPGTGGLSASVGTTGSAARMLVRTLPGNVNLRVPSGGMEDRLVDHLTSRSNTATPSVWFDFDRIGFETGSASLTAESREQLVNVAQILRAYPAARTTVAGFTDNTEDEAANLALSQSRATAVAAALQASGVPASRIQIGGFGSRNPTADNSTEAGRTQNRLVALQINLIG